MVNKRPTTVYDTEQAILEKAMRRLAEKDDLLQGPLPDKLALPLSPYFRSSQEIFNLAEKESLTPEEKPRPSRPKHR